MLLFAMKTEDSNAMHVRPPELCGLFGHPSERSHVLARTASLGRNFLLCRQHTTPRAIESPSCQSQDVPASRRTPDSRSRIHSSTTSKASEAERFDKSSVSFKAASALSADVRNHEAKHRIQ